MGIDPSTLSPKQRAMIHPNEWTAPPDCEQAAPNEADRPATKPPRSSGYKRDVVLAWFRDQGIPEPHFEYRFHPVRKWRWDMAWLYQSPRESDLALEVQGGIWHAGRHNRGAAILAEWEKLNAGAILGWRVLFCQPRDLCAQEMAETIKRALGL